MHALALPALPYCWAADNVQTWPHGCSSSFRALCVPLFHAVCRLSEETCEGLGVAVCGTPSMSLKAGFEVKMSNKHSAATGNEMRIEVGGASLRGSPLWRTCMHT